MKPAIADSGLPNSESCNTLVIYFFDGKVNLNNSKPSNELLRVILNHQANTATKNGPHWGGGSMFFECEYMGTSLSLSIKEQFNIRGLLW